MTNKKNKYHKKRQHSPPPAKVPINEELLASQCLELHELLKNRTARLRAMKSGELCYLLSTRWLQEWKEYVGYEALVEEESEKAGKKDKKYGKRHPGKINSDVVASGVELREFYTIPKEMEDYQYLNQMTNQKKEKDDDFIAVTPEIWLAFLNYYEGEQIRRPVKINKGSVYYDGEPLRCDVIFANLAEQELQERIKKTNRKNYNAVFPSQKLLLSNLWTFKDLKQFLSIYCGVTYHNFQIRIWKGYSYIATNPIMQALIQSIKDRSFTIKGRELTQQRYKDHEIDEYIKSTHTLIVEIGDLLKGEKMDDGEIKGYCEECVEKKSLMIGCMCNQVLYCSYKCRTNDQNYHYQTCEIAFDSQDDEEYEKISTDETSLAGLDNIGNTCYMNSTFQALFSLNHIRNFFSTNQYIQHMSEKEVKDNKCRFLTKLSKTLKALRQEKFSYTPWPLKSQIDYNLSPFRGDKQHDANDFLVNFLNTINDHLTKPEEKAYHHILQPFVGEFYSKVLCPICNGVSENNQIFLQISLPIKAKVVQKIYQYTVVESLLLIRRGKSSVCEDWQEMKESIGAENSLVCITKEPIGLQLIDEAEDTPDKVTKGRGDVIFYKNQTLSQGEVPFVFGLVTTKTIVGNKLKSSYGVPLVILVKDHENTLGTFWLQIIRTYFAENKEVVDAANAMRMDYWAEIENDSKIIESEDSKVEEDNEKSKEERLNERRNKIVDHFTERLKALAQKIGIQVYINHFKRSRNMCKFCNKKCNNCDLPKTFDRPFTEFFAQRYEEVKFEVFLREPINIEYKNQDKNINGDPTLHDCLEIFTQPEELDEENAWYCGQCDSMALALKQLHVKSFPSILVIHLNRFKTFQHKKMKNSDPIQYQQTQTFGGKDYRLISVIMHEGSMDAGHYWSICLRKGEYYIFNDAKVSKAERVFNRNAYILIYQLASFNG